MNRGARWSVAICPGKNALVESERVARLRSGEDMVS